MTNYLDWKIGDEVECIDNSSQTTHLKCKQVYKISAIIAHDNWNYNNCSISIQLTGFTFPLLRDDGKRATSFGAWRFRKLQKRKTDISVFTAMLNQTELTNKIELTVKERMPENV